MILLHVSCLVLHFLIVPTTYAKKVSIQEKSTKMTSSPTDTTPLVLQWEVSHLRNTDQISLIFKQKTVELVTNTSSYQKGKTVRLGHFESPISFEWKELKEQIKRYYVRLKKTVPISQLVKDPRVRPLRDPHTPVLRINEEKIYSEHPYFKPLASIIYQIWSREWFCLECAIYTKNKKFIVRTLKKFKLNPKQNTNKEKNQKAITKNQWEEKKQSFPHKLLNCIHKVKKKVECIDPQFGIFEI